MIASDRIEARRREGARRRAKLTFRLDGVRHEIEGWYASPEEGRRELVEHVTRRWPGAVVAP